MKSAILLSTNILNALVGVALIAGVALSVRASEDVAPLLENAINGAHRAVANRARDAYRHPKETLLFLGIKPNMTVVEVWPSTGWWTEILAPFLKSEGKYYAAWFPTESKGTPDYVKDREKSFDAMLAAGPDIYGKVIKTKLLAPEFVDLAPKGSADMVLTFRNVHNWAKQGNTDPMFKAFYDVLKTGGILGVKDHRAKPGASFDAQVKSGYLTEEYVINAAEKAGFKLVGKSEVNANPKDSADHPEGVWTLPPTLRLKDKDKDKYLAIGESDRMTLKFVKP